MKAIATGSVANDFGKAGQILQRVLVGVFASAGDDDVDRDLLPRTVLLHGPSGIGKTRLVAELCQDMSLPIMHMDVRRIIRDFSGDTPAVAYACMFREAFDSAPCIAMITVLLEDVDSQFPALGNSGDGGDNPRSAFVLDFVDMLVDVCANARAAGTSPVLVLATTRDPTFVDPWVLDAFELFIELTIPSKNSRRSILRRCMSESNLQISPAVHLLDDEFASLDDVADICHGFMACDLAEICSPSTSFVSGNYPREMSLSALARVADTVRRECVLPRSRWVGSASMIPASAQPIRAGTGVKWDNIGGLMDVKLALEQSIVWFDKHRSAFRRLGITPPNGLLLYGPPGTGKTMLARAVAMQSGLNFLPVSIPDLILGEIGESEKAVSRLFREANSLAPCVVFLDEIDAIFGTRDDSSEYGSKLVTQLLLEMDEASNWGAQDDDGERIILLAATNFPGAIDPALLRSGRLDRLVYVPPPDTAGRLDILQTISKSMRFSDDLLAKLESVASKTGGFSGADLAGLVRSAALECLARHPLDADTGTIEVLPEDMDVALASAAPSITPKMLSMYEEFRNNLAL